MTKHSKGPWRQMEETLVYIPGCKLTADFGESGATPEESIANAKLAATAPDLLESLQNTVSLLEHYGLTEENEGMKLARAAIKKATE